MDFEILEHTGDVGIKYYGSTIEELFSNAVKGTAFLIGEPEENCTRVEQELRFRWSDLQDLMYQLLDKIVYYFEVDEVLYDTVRYIDYSDPANTTVKLSGCRITEKFDYKYIMKAPTFHQMELNPEKGYGVQIFDI